MKGIGMKPASQRIGGSETQVRDWLNRGVDPSIDKFVKLAQVLGVSPSFLLSGDERFQIQVPLRGVSSGAERWTPFQEPTAGRSPEMADFDFSPEGEAFAIEIRGDAMSPAYRDGDQLFCQKRAGKFLDNLIGLDCAIKTTAGDTLIKILDKGTVPGHYTLRSYNPLSRPMENVEIEWAAPITWVRRGGR
jgi:transcriptional regulator with XRE-family HTH domain